MILARIRMITTWGIRCGVAEYSGGLKAGLDKLDFITTEVFGTVKPKSTNPFAFLRLVTKLDSSQMVHFQYQPSIYGRRLLPIMPLGYFPLLIFVAKMLNRCKVIITIHEIGLNGILNRVNLKFLNLSDTLVVPSQAMSESLVRNGIERRKIRIVPLGTPDPWILPKEDCKRELGVQGKKVLTILGFIQKYKGHDLLIDIMPKLGENVVLVIAGTTLSEANEAYCRSLKEQISNLGIQDRVRFLGYVNESELPTLLSATDVAIFPYRWITGSAALHRVLSYRIPTVTSDLDYFREMKQRYDCIELFESENRNQLLETIERLLNSDEMQNRLQTMSDRFCRETGWDSIASETANLYLELVSAHPEDLYVEEHQRERIDWLKSNVAGRVLEIGSATGFVTNYVGASSGVDIRRDRTLLASRKYPHVDFIECNASFLPFSDCSFDTVLLPEILEHVQFEIAQLILREAYRVSKSSILITLPNASRPGWSDDSAIGGKNPEHMWAPTHALVTRKLLDGYDFEISPSNESLFWFVRIFKIRENRASECG